MISRVLGVDPGPVTGVALLHRDGVPLLFQCNAVAAWGLVAWLASESREDPLRAGIEAFVPGRGAGARDAGAAVTRALVTELVQLPRIAWSVRSAAMVKPWATGKRLTAAGLALWPGMPHAADAARHALFAAVHDGGWPDPLSREWNRVLARG